MKVAALNIYQRPLFGIIFNLFLGSIKRTDYNGHSLFHWAVQNKDIGLCRILISKGCDIETSNNFGVTPLMLASFCGYIDIVRLLLLLKADVESINTYGILFLFIY